MSRAARSRGVAVTAIVVAVAAVGPTDVPPLGPGLPALADHFAVTSAQVGLVVTAYAAPGALAAPVIGGLADRYGRRRVLVPSLLLFGAFGLAAGLVDSFLALLVLRAAQGLVGGSILTSLAYTLVGDRWQGTDRNRVMGLASGAASTTAAVGPAVGGALADLAWNAPFGVYALPVVVGLAVWLWLPADDASGPAGAGAVTDTDGPTRGPLGYLRDVVGSVPAGRALAVYGAGFLAFALFFGGVVTAVPFVLTAEFGLPAGEIGLLVTAASLVGAVVATQNGRFAARTSDDALMGAGVAVSGGSLGIVAAAVLPASPAAGSLPVLAGGLIVFGVGYGLFQPSQAAALAELGPERVRGGVLSLRTSVVLLGQAVGPPLFTLPAVALGLGYGVPLAGFGLLGLLAGGAGVGLATRI